MDIRFYICVLFIALNSYVLLFAGGSGYDGPDVLDFDTALEKVRGGEIVEELHISGGGWISNCTSPEKYPYLIEFRELKILSIYGCGLKEVPQVIFGLQQLEYLNLGGNELKEIPEGIGELSKLKELSLERNQISKLPESIGHLVNLEELSLTGNNISVLPESIGHLMNLEKLDLQSNQLSILPSSIVNLINLKVIDGSFNGFDNGNYNGSKMFIFSKKYTKETNFYNMWTKTSYKKFIKGLLDVPHVYTVTPTSGLSVRNKPKLKAKKIGSMPYKLKIAVYEESSKIETIDGITAPWMRIKAVANGQYMEGWAWGGYLKVYKYEEDYQLRFQDMVNRMAGTNSKLTLDTKQVQFLIKNGADINTESDDGSNGWTLLNIVADVGNIKDFRFLLANGADFKIKSEYGMSVAMAVVLRKDIGFESKKVFFSVLQDYGYNFKAEGRELLKEAMYFSFSCGVTIEEQNFDSKELDFLKDQLDIKNVSEILSDEEIQTIYYNIRVHNICEDEKLSLGRL